MARVVSMKDGRASTSPAPMSSEDYRDRNGIGFIDVGGDQKALSGETS
jgi:hypothetical protein